MEKLKNSKGITLIALVITIIVLLILAAVSISALTGEDGILKRAGDAQEESRRAKAEEQMDMEAQRLLVEAIQEGKKFGEYAETKKGETMTSGVKIEGETIKTNVVLSYDGYKKEYDENGKAKGETNKGDISDTEEVYLFTNAYDNKNETGTIELRVGFYNGTYEEFAKEIINGKTKEQLGTMLYEGNNYWNIVDDYEEPIYTSLEELIEYWNDNYCNGELTDYDSIGLYYGYDTTEEMLIDWEYLNPKGYYGESYAEYAGKILEGKTKEELEEIFYKGVNYVNNGNEPLYKSFQELLTYWNENYDSGQLTDYDSIGPCYGYNTTEKMMIYREYVNPEGYYGKSYEEYAREIIFKKTKTELEEMLYKGFNKLMGEEKYASFKELLTDLNTSYFNGELTGFDDIGPKMENKTTEELMIRYQFIEIEQYNKQYGKILSCEEDSYFKQDRVSSGDEYEYQIEGVGTYTYTFVLNYKGKEIIKTVNLTLNRAEPILLDAEETSNFLGSTMRRREIERISILDSIGSHSTSDSNCWDVSLAQKGHVLAWSEDKDSDGYYEVYMASDTGKIIANENSSQLFYNIGEEGDSQECIVGLDNLDVSNVTNMEEMFAGCGYKSMTNLNLGNNFDTSKVTNMERMFEECGYESMINLNLGNNFDTSKVTNMKGMFEQSGYESMINLDLGDKFNTYNVTNMEDMFTSCGNESMTSLDLGDKFNTYNVTNMSGMFAGCGYESMISLDLGDKFDTSNVTDMRSMFDGMVALQSLDLGDKFDTSKVEDMGYMFSTCGYYNMTSLNLGDKFNTVNVKDMSAMFQRLGYKKLTSLNLGNKFDTSNVEDMYFMFNGCGLESLTSLDLGSKFNVSNVIDMRNMFAWCGMNNMKKLYIDAISFDNIESYSQIFRECGAPDCQIYVKDVAAQNWILNLTGDDRVSTWSISNILIK